MTKKHIQASGDKEGQLVDCPAEHQCTLKGPDGQPQQHFDLARSREAVQDDLHELNSTRKERADDDEYEQVKGKLLRELAEHNKAEFAQKKYAEHMAKKYSSGSTVGAGRAKLYGDTQFTKKELNTVAEDVHEQVRLISEDEDMGSSAKDLQEDRVIADAFYRHTGKEKVTDTDILAVHKLAHATIDKKRKKQETSKKPLRTVSDMSDKELRSELKKAQDAGHDFFANGLKDEYYKRYPDSF